MLEAAAHHGPGRTAWREGPVGLGRAGRHADPGLAGEGRRRVAFSGCLHDRDGLQRVLGLPAGVEAGDADLLLAAYERWGDDCPAHLVGEFAFVLWDGERGRLVAARDATGTRTLFYARGRGAWTLASECGQLTAHPEAAPEPDCAALRRLLELDLEDVGMT